MGKRTERQCEEVRLSGPLSGGEGGVNTAADGEFAPLFLMEQEKAEPDQSAMQMRTDNSSQRYKENRTTHQKISGDVEL